MTPDEAVFRQHLEAANFQYAILKGRWTLEAVAWPVAIFQVNAKRPNGQIDSYWFRFNLGGYPQTAPTAFPSYQDGTLLPPEKWPNGNLISAAFNPNWRTNALYLPCDREAMPGHEGWRHDHPNLWWTPDKSIYVYLNELYELLNLRDYSGTRSG